MDKQTTLSPLIIVLDTMIMSLGLWVSHLPISMNSTASLEFLEWVSTSVYHFP
jgi:hypothetical protein